MRRYGLGFISDEDLFAHVKETVEKYRFKIDLKRFNKNLLKSLYLLAFSNYDGFDTFDI